MHSEVLSMASNPLISVIVPVYKAEKHLDKCVRSILSQTYHNLEVILVDDGSPDRSGELCDAFAAEDNRVRVIHQKNGGVSAARNAGLDAMQSQFFCFVDSDDYVDAEMIQKLYDAILANDADMSICGYRRITEKRLEDRPGTSAAYEGEKPIANFVLRNYLDATISAPWGKLYKSNMLAGLRFDQSISLGEDTKFNVQYFEKSCNVVVIEDCLYNYMDCAGSLSNSYKKGYYEGICSLYQATISYAECVFADIQEADLRKVNYKLVSCCGIFMARNGAVANSKAQKLFIQQICDNPLVQRAARDLPDMSLIGRIFVWAIKRKKISVLCLLSWMKRVLCL